MGAHLTDQRLDGTGWGTTITGSGRDCREAKT
jgi:hypothetical protein